VGPPKGGHPTPQSRFGVNTPKHPSCTPHPRTSISRGETTRRQPSRSPRQHPSRFFARQIRAPQSTPLQDGVPGATAREFYGRRSDLRADAARQQGRTDAHAPGARGRRRARASAVNIAGAPIAAAINLRRHRARHARPRSPASPRGSLPQSWSCSCSALAAVLVALVLGAGRSPAPSARAVPCRGGQVASVSGPDRARVVAHRAREVQLQDAQQRLERASEGRASDCYREDRFDLYALPSGAECWPVGGRRRVDRAGSSAQGRRPLSAC